MNEYQQQLLDHYHNPRNFGKPNFVPTSNSKSSNLSCGDEIELWLSITEGGLITDVAFGGEGCSICIASSSLFYEFLKGKNIKEMDNIDEDFVLGLVGIPLTISRIKCALLPLDAFKKTQE